MDFVQALKGGNDSIINYFQSRRKPIEKSNLDHINYVIESMEQKFKVLLNDEDYEKPEFLVPELPKPKREAKGKRKSGGKSTTFKISTKPSQETQHERAVSSADESSDSVDSTEIVRKSSRIASKASRVPKQEVFSDAQSLSSNRIGFNETYAKPVEPIAEIPPINNHNSKIVRRSSRIDQNTTLSTIATVSTIATGYATANDGFAEPVSPFLPPAKIRCIENVNFEKHNISRQILDMSAFSVGIKEEQPLGSSTPTNPFSETFVKVQLNTPNQSDSARKMKIPKSTIYSESSSSAKNATRTRNQEKILQEKNINVKLIEEKCEEARKKREDKIKSSAEETKRKREERARKVAASREAATLEKKKQIQKQEAEKEIKLKQIEKQKDEKRLEMVKKKQMAAIKVATEKRRKEEEEKATLPKIKKPIPESELVEYALDNVLEENVSSDDEERPKNQVPSWATKENRTRPLKIQAYISKVEMIRPWFFDRSLRYPKLEELFAGANVKNRPRASSALWNTVIDFDEAFPLHD